MKKVYILQHEHEIGPDTEDVKLIGVYSSYENAKNAIQRLSEQSGFQNSRDGFCIDEYEIDSDHWTEGFITIKQESR